MKQRNRFTRVKGKLVSVGAAVGGAVASSAAMAAPALDVFPADLAGAEAFMEAYGLVAIGVAAIITLITLGIKGNKLPRRG